MTGPDRSAGLDEMIIENANVMIVVMDGKGTISVWNKAAESITGFSREEVIGKNQVWKELYPKADYRSEVNTKIGNLLFGHNYFENLETTITTRCGRDKIISWNAREIQEGTTTCIISVALDITRQYEFERKIKELGEFQEGIIDNAHILILVMDKSGNVLVWNHAAEEITGYQREEVIGHSAIWKSLYPDLEYRKAIRKKIRAALEDHRYFENLETIIRTKSGEERIISWNTRETGQDDLVREIALGRDITRLRAAEQALIAYISEIAMRIRNPVEIIRDNLRDIAGLIRRGNISPDDIPMLLDGQVRNATQVVENVGDLQRAIALREKEIPEAYRKFLGQ